jgi:N-acetylmuramoyl-L-alanine amidase
MIDANVEHMAQVMYHEARGESERGQVAVGQVVLNRVADPRFPKTIKGVVTQKSQFSGFRIRKIPQHFYKLAQRVIQRDFPNYIGNALYFNNFSSKKCKIRIESHCFW